MSELEQLLTKLDQLTKAIEYLAQTNIIVANAMSGDDEVETNPDTYIDGKPCR